MAGGLQILVNEYGPRRVFVERFRYEYGNLARPLHANIQTAIPEFIANLLSSMPIFTTHIFPTNMHELGQILQSVQSRIGPNIPFSAYLLRPVF